MSTESSDMLQTIPNVTRNNDESSGLGQESNQLPPVEPEIPSNTWKCRKCNKINDNRIKRCRKPCYSWRPGVKRRR